VADFLEVKTTAGSKPEAEKLGRAAVEARVAACAQVSGPISSVYWWNGSLEQAEEWVCVFKVPAANFDELAGLVKREHSYDTPEIIATPVSGGSREYLAWVAEEASG
jgi:periplasmic divalent cation tolerance protein